MLGVICRMGGRGRERGARERRKELKQDVCSYHRGTRTAPLPAHLPRAAAVTPLCGGGGALGAGGWRVAQSRRRWCRSSRKGAPPWAYRRRRSATHHPRRSPARVRLDGEGAPRGGAHRRASGLAAQPWPADPPPCRGSGGSVAATDAWSSCSFSFFLPPFLYKKGRTRMRMDTWQRVPQGIQLPRQKKARRRPTPPAPRRPRAPTRGVAALVAATSSSVASARERARSAALHPARAAAGPSSPARSRPAPPPPASAVPPARRAGGGRHPASRSLTRLAAAAARGGGGGRLGSPPPRPRPIPSPIRLCSVVAAAAAVVAGAPV